MSPNPDQCLAYAKLNRAAKEHRDAQRALTAAHDNLEQAREQLRATGTSSAITELAPDLARWALDLDLDNDPRDPETQAADFFTRPGDFHQVDLTIPLEDEPALKLGAQFVIKFTEDQKPLIIEVLRQLRGALAARITITRLEQTSGRNSTPNETPDPRNRAATELGLPPDQLNPIPMSNGQTAWAHTPPPTPAHTGRHHKPDADENPACCDGGPQWGHAWNCPKLP